MDQQHVPWAAASMLIRRHGDDAPLIVAQRLGELAVEGDLEGISMWKSIAACMDKLTRRYDDKAQ